MDQSSGRSRSAPLVALVAAGLPAAVAATLGALPPLRPAEADQPWIVPAFAGLVAACAAVAALAFVVRVLRTGSPRALLSAGSSASLAGGAVGVLTNSASLALPVLGAALLLLAAGMLGDRRMPDRSAARVGAVVGVLIAAEALTLASVLPATSATVAPIAAVILGIAAATWIAVGWRAPVVRAAAVGLAAGGSYALAIDRGGGLESVVALAVLGGSQLLLLSEALDSAPEEARSDERLPDLASRLDDAVLRFDGRLRLRDWNAAAGTMLDLDASSAGARIDDLLGVSLSDLPAGEDIAVSHGRVGGLEVAMHRSGGGLVSVIRDPGTPAEPERLASELRTTIEELLRARRTIDLQRGELERSATVDPLTGVASRGAILERLRIEVAQARRYRHPLAIVLLDVDRFGDINAEHGIGGGDGVLREVALRMRLRVREADAIGRCGSDGFLAALPHTDEAGAATFADAMRRRLAQRPIHVGGDEVSVTVSIGVATMRPGEDLDVDGLLARVEEALDSARSAGGDRIALDRAHGLARLEPRPATDDEPSSEAR
jgi:diguanylate cyclase (GGDEF)-like protein